MLIERVLKANKISLPDWWTKSVTKKRNTANANATTTIIESDNTDVLDAVNVTVSNKNIDYAFATTSDQGYSFFKYDTAVTIHICKDRYRFVSLKPATRRILHEDTESIATENGAVILSVETPFETKSVQLDNVFYVPEFHFNLISASQLEKQGYWIHAYQRYLINSKDNSIIQLFFY